MINIILLTNFVNLKYNIYYTGTDTYNYKLLLTECHHFYSKLILTILEILGLSRKISPPYLSKKSYRRYFYRCTVHLEDSLSITPTNALVYHALI